LDRMDKALSRSIWHEDGTAHYHDLFEGTADEFVEWVFDAHENLERHSHQLSSRLFIDVDGFSARSEAYVTIALWTKPDSGGSQQEFICKGRHLDRWSCKRDVWAIDHREHVLDMHSLYELNRADVSAVSSRDENDLSFRFFQS